MPRAEEVICARAQIDREKRSTAAHKNLNIEFNPFLTFVSRSLINKQSPGLSDRVSRSEEPTARDAACGTAFDLVWPTSKAIQRVTKTEFSGAEMSKAIWDSGELLAQPETRQNDGHFQWALRFPLRM